MGLKRSTTKTINNSLPNEWQSISFGEIAEKIVGGGTPRRSIKQYWGGQYPWVTVKDLTSFNPYQTEEYITKEGLNNSATHLIPKSTLITSTRMALGKAVIYYVDVCINQDIKAIFPKKEVDTKFLYYWFQNNSKQIEELGSGSTVLGLSLVDLKRINVILPPLPEQISIAEVLFDTDNLIQSLEKQIEKKQLIKQGAMQQLFIPKPNWNKRKIKEIVSVPVTDGPHETPKFLKTGVPFLSVNNLIDNKIDWKELRFISKVDDARFSLKCKPKRNDLLLGKAASVGKVAIVETDIDFNIWSPLALIRLKGEYYPKFLYYSFLTRGALDQIGFFTNSSSQGNIGMGEIEKLEFCFPDYIEQIYIATTISDMDLAIAKVQKKLEKYKLIKQGLIQNLLTGRIRLIND